MTDFSVNKILKVLHIVALYSKYTRALTSDFFFCGRPESTNLDLLVENLSPSTSYQTPNAFAGFCACMYYAKTAR